LPTRRSTILAVSQRRPRGSGALFYAATGVSV